MVKTATGSQLTFNLKRSGFYVSNGIVWNKLSNAQVLFTDDELTFKDDGDNTKQLGFQLENIATATRRTASWPDKNGTVAMTDDLPLTVNLTGNYNLPTSATWTRRLRLVNRAGVSYTITADGTDTVEDETSQIIHDGETFDLALVGTNWVL